MTEQVVTPAMTMEEDCGLRLRDQAPGRWSVPSVGLAECAQLTERARKHG
jgi:hypothetical protein